MQNLFDMKKTVQFHCPFSRHGKARVNSSLFIRLVGNVLSLLAVATLAGCDALDSLTAARKAQSQGSPYELVVVCQPREWDGEVGDTLRSVFTQPLPVLNDREPLFDVLRVTNQTFTALARQHRNILKVEIDPVIDSAFVAVQYDVTASPQIVLTLQAPDDASATAYLSEHRDDLLHVLEMAERDRSTAYAEKFNEAFIESRIKQHFGVAMHVPKGYDIRNEQDDFMWISYEYPAASQGFFIYSYPYEGKESLSLEALTAAREKYAARIPGPSDGSYMITSEAFEPEWRAFRIDGRLWIELRGFWDVRNDFMGGPFVSYTTVNTETNEVFTLDCYVYSPKLHKRNYLRNLEHLLYGIGFPAQDAGAGASE